MMKVLRRRGTKAAIDSALLVGFVAEFLTREGPNYNLHSWVGIVLTPIIVVHLVSNLGWVQRVARRRREDREFSLALLNLALGVMASVCIGTGFPVWLYDGAPDAVSTVHTMTGFASWILMFAHLWRNRGRIRQMVGRA